MAKPKHNPGFMPYIDPRQVEGERIRKMERDRIKRMVQEELDLLRRQYGGLPENVVAVPLSALTLSLEQLYERI